MSERVVVIGAGVGGTMAAVAARQAGFEASVVSSGSGASVMTSGALDWSPWWTSEPHPDLPDAVRAPLESLLAELSLGLGPRWLITGAGVVRPAAGSDDRLLDLAALPADATVGVVCSNWELDSGQALLRSLQADPRAGGRTFVAVSADRLFSEVERTLPLAALLERFSPETAERLVAVGRAARIAGVAALLVGPYLGVDPRAREVLSRAPIPIGETTSPPEGSAGRRLEQRLPEVLHRRGIPLEAARVTNLHIAARGVILTLETAGSGGRVTRSESCERVVLATGGLIGGGLDLGSGAGEGIGSPLLEAARGTGSLLGWDGASDGGSWLRSGLGPGAPRQSHGGRVLAVGDVCAAASQTFLTAARAGISLFWK